jgi:hypothetical protein
MKMTEWTLHKYPGPIQYHLNMTFMYEFACIMEVWSRDDEWINYIKIQLKIL